MNNLIGKTLTGVYENSDEMYLAFDNQEVVHIRATKDQYEDCEVLETENKILERKRNGEKFNINSVEPYIQYELGIITQEKMEEIEKEEGILYEEVYRNRIESNKLAELKLYEDLKKKYEK